MTVLDVIDTEEVDADLTLEGDEVSGVIGVGDNQIELDDYDLDTGSETPLRPTLTARPPIFPRLRQTCLTPRLTILCKIQSQLITGGEDS